MKISEAFEGENSSLRKTFDECCESEELKKEWEREFEVRYKPNENYVFDEVTFLDLKSFISSLLAKQQSPTAMTNSEWVAYGKKMGYHDYWKDMTRIAVEEEVVADYQTNYEQKHIASAIEVAKEEFVKMIEDRLKDSQDHYSFLALSGLLADIKSKLK